MSEQLIYESHEVYNFDVAFSRFPAPSCPTIQA